MAEGQARAFDLAVGAGVTTVKRFEHPFLLFERDAGSVILDINLRHAPLDTGDDSHRRRAACT